MITYKFTFTPRFQKHIKSLTAQEKPIPITSEEGFKKEYCCLAL